MTRERALYFARQMDAEFAGQRDEQADVILAAVAEETERCAKIAEYYDADEFVEDDKIHIAAKIRRSDP